MFRLRGSLIGSSESFVPSLRSITGEVCRWAVRGQLHIQGEHISSHRMDLYAEIAEIRPP